MIEGQQVYEIYLITRGFVTIGPIDPQTDSQKCYLEFSGKSYFGEFEVLSGEASAYTTRVQQNNTVGYTIFKKAVMEVLKKHDFIRKKLLSEGKNRNREIKKVINDQKQNELLVQDLTQKEQNSDKRNQNILSSALGRRLNVRSKNQKFDEELTLPQRISKMRDEVKEIKKSAKIVYKKFEVISKRVERLNNYKNEQIDQNDQLFK